MNGHPPSSPSPPQDTDLVKRLDSIEGALDRIESIRRNLVWGSLAAFLLILALFALFFYRLYDYGRTYDRDALMTMVKADAEEILARNYRLFVQQVERDRIVERFVEQCLNEFEKAKPELTQQINQMTSRLVDHVAKGVEDRLYKALSRALEAQAEELKRTFAGFEPDQLQKILDDAKANFVEKLHDSIEERLAAVIPSLLGLQSSVEAVAQTGAKEELSPEMLGEVEARLFEALFEIILYELNPKRGAEPVTPLTSGTGK